MILEFKNVCKLSNGKKRQLTVKDLSFTITKNESLSILCQNEIQRIQLIHLLTGASLPDSGQVNRRSSITTPIGDTGIFHGEMTLRENLHFISELYGKNSRELIPTVFSYINHSIDKNQKFKQLNAIEKRKIGMAMNLAISPDVYIIRGDISFPDKTFRDKFEKDFREAITTTSTAITVTPNLQIIKKYFQKCISIDNSGYCEYFDNIEAGISEFNSLSKKG